MSLSVQSPAKLNLFLHITGRRDDGYHNLQTLFQFIDLCDTLHFDTETTAGIEVEAAIPGIEPQHNLVHRAAALLKEHTGSPRGAHIRLEKHLPMGGGLGGGSSNAASTLVALNHLWQTGLNRAQLCQLGLHLGADVPIFVHGHAALAVGVGERFEDVSIEEPWYLIAAPNCHASTAELFQEKQLTRNSKVIRIRDFLNGVGHNDFEPVLRRRFPLVDRCLALMNSEGQAKVTGSGACLFMRCNDQVDTETKRHRLTLKMSDFGITDQDLKWHTAKGCNHSPLYFGALANQR
ncbi:MAG: 4-(cytidine 5'-diphospho)-2-C-methyl-D-erythritol kinase [Pseudomonadota bacterium]|nr:4-(cytidine 5'-diphospho)-2-C-methyl-D-erythritol kinase [Pseudomonadota bacterium]